MWGRRKMIKTEITCDECKKDLTTTDYAVAFMHTLSSRSIQNCGKVTYAARKNEPLKRDYHFCSIKCLNVFVIEGFLTHEN